MRAPDYRPRIAFAIVALLILVSCSNLVSSSESRTTTVWSGNVILPDGYLVDSGEVLSISAGTTVSIGSGHSLDVDGRIIISGSVSSPVVINSISGNHEGLVFNYSCLLYTSPSPRDDL